MSEKRSLLAIAIGPVQDFIAASRKARDLWAGSDLLSELCRAAAVSLKDHGELIFPPDGALDEDHAVANKLLVSTPDPEPGMVAERARQALQDRLEQQWQDRSLQQRLREAGADTDLGASQIAEFVEWYAAWVPYDPGRTDGDGSYRDARQHVELLLAGRKALRHFGPARGIGGRPKSSLDPSRESIITTDQQRQPRVREALHLRPNEFLDAVSLLKRFAGEERFVSTSRVAIDPFIRAVEPVTTTKGNSLATLRDLADILKATDVSEWFRTAHPSPDPGTGQPAHNPVHHYRAFPYDSQLFYELSVSGAWRQMREWEDPGDEDGPLKAAAGRFYETVCDLKSHLGEDFPELPAYYAVIHADGDRMGSALNTLTRKQDHQSFSVDLGTFAERAGTIVRMHFGALIYSGGDDVLAFLPLDTALPCADALRQAFHRIMQQSDALKDKGIDPLPTLSVGVAIGHYAEHLQVILNRARAAERAAKGPRNALAVSFSAHSGGGDERTVVHSWDVDPVGARWAPAIDFHRHDTLPDGAGYELDALGGEWQRTFFDATGRPHPSNPDDVAGVLRKEALRILKRKQPRQGTAETKEELLLTMERRLTLRPGDDSIRDLKDTLRELGAFVDEAIIARRIARLLLDDDAAAVASWNAGREPRVLKPRRLSGAGPIPREDV